MPMNPVAKLWREDRAEDELMIVVLYDRPLDHPDGAVLRAQYTSGRGVRPHANGLRCQLDGAYKFMQKNFSDLAYMPRAEADEPQIVCSWL
jgi:hypothetical protein